ncbi:hypothetical protein FISHEDRAFT_78184 [Fistulina hepatica ATCC 64428]|nr:hypothetical protein FISHEDRAFT_78184 [Fistulina hepatica ATCC 64428]
MEEIYQMPHNANSSTSTNLLPEISTSNALFPLSGTSAPSLPHSQMLSGGPMSTMMNLTIPLESPALSYDTALFAQKEEELINLQWKQQYFELLQWNNWLEAENTCLNSIKSEGLPPALLSSNGHVSLICANYPHIHFWTCKDWQDSPDSKVAAATLNIDAGTSSNSTDSASLPIPWVEDLDGSIISGHLAYLHLKGLAPEKWKQISSEGILYFNQQITIQCPELSYCDNFWKARELCTLNYPSWAKTHVRGVKKAQNTKKTTQKLSATTGGILSETAHIPMDIDVEVTSSLLGKRSAPTDNNNIQIIEPTTSLATLAPIVNTSVDTVVASSPHIGVATSPPHTDVVASLPHTNVDASLLHTDVVTSLLHTNVVTLLPHTDVVALPPHTGVASSLLHTGVVASLPHTGVVSSLPHTAVVASSSYTSTLFVTPSLQDSESLNVPLLHSGSASISPSLHNTAASAVSSVSASFPDIDSSTAAVALASQGTVSLAPLLTPYNSASISLTSGDLVLVIQTASPSRKESQPATTLQLQYGLSPIAARRRSHNMTPMKGSPIRLTLSPLRSDMASVHLSTLPQHDILPFTASPLSLDAAAATLLPDAVPTAALLSHNAVASGTCLAASTIDVVANTEISQLLPHEHRGDGPPPAKRRASFRLVNPLFDNDIASSMPSSASASANTTTPVISSASPMPSGTNATGLDVLASLTSAMNKSLPSDIRKNTICGSQPRNQADSKITFLYSKLSKVISGEL